MKLVSETKTNAYELTYLVSAGFTDSELKKVQEEVLALVKKFKGEVISETVWGKKPLAYTLKTAGKSHDEAYFIHLKLSISTEKAPEVERGVYLINSIIRHLFVVADETKVEDKETSTEE
ncbi:MAG: 30S ribosomal protein S6 [Candidatus Pacebacteria bacterium CG10_big_fil_rev_8_21_14_0_10_36_11]|nr:30S ribosomal protein S6 [Candidatus Pacearchaeota archaeon]OIP74041.1 MAG: 30S ribosomal protein S6 [Candidatus Pacebacteria bacterium CG2_30_36_39]PIR64317.1 MAG: 30S ribosomal protein S6 [Candidatus Pacebacteria bacterium CG10_big_fil_rev_8_21_14_0_10_36_11]PJC43215.1 MAG: 30S ribosomal protein S6 [Candidatus Pacebacteria bacterium CG_4_9_14_0_2_um_filter_36_8]